MVKNPPANACYSRRHGYDPGVKKIPWSRKWQPTSVVSPGKSRTEEPGRLQSMGLQAVGHDLRTKQQQLNYIQY